MSHRGFKYNYLLYLDLTTIINQDRIFYQYLYHVSLSKKSNVTENYRAIK